MIDTLENPKSRHANSLNQHSDHNGNGSLATTITTNDFPVMTSHNIVAIAIIIGIEGPSYRPLGATMVCLADGSTHGTLSSGCIDADIAFQAQEVGKTGQCKILRYGKGSLFIDLRLPCGGALDILICPSPEPNVIERAQNACQTRQPITLFVHDNGIELEDLKPCLLQLTIIPDPRFFVFGKGPEAVAFSGMTAASGYETQLFSPDEETLSQMRTSKAEGIYMPSSRHLEPVRLDAYSAGILFFHDHAQEIAILNHLLKSPAFYIGAQGSRRSAARRQERLLQLGLGPDHIDRVRGPIGLIASTRDARTLAVSVLAEILVHYQEKQNQTRLERRPASY